MKIPEMILTLNAKLEGFTQAQVTALMAERGTDEPSEEHMNMLMELHGVCFSAMAQVEAGLIRWMSEKVGLSLEQAREQIEFVVEAKRDWEESADELVEELDIRYK